MVKTTALVIVVSGLKVRDEELEGVSDGVGVIEDSEETEESCELVEEVWREVVKEDVVDEDDEVVVEVEVDSVDVGSLVDVLGGPLVEVGEGSLSAQISGPTLGDGSTVRTWSWAVQTGAERIRSPHYCLGHPRGEALNFAWAENPELSNETPWLTRTRDLPQRWEHLLWELQLEGLSVGSLRGASGEGEPVAGISGGSVDQRPWWGIDRQAGWSSYKSKLLQGAGCA